ncbi:hypothetical protein DID88_003094 [Monilinia fructigena]|uniref:Vacuolar protein-sorting-associated protein 36 n=1 Tax=Monilinia fructigena TaxID=38457 RepID=A0A395IV52_9HELO|nr:hypothetical protein DID88_003094 [Monilinia fructigena]
MACLNECFLKHLDLTTALRPSYLPDEVNLFVQDNVGLYEGKYKIPDHQNGQVYLTSHRICYVDNEDPRRNSTAIELKEVDRFEFYAGFLKSSAKITLVPKPSKRSSVQNRAITSLNSATRSATSSPLSRTETPFHLPTPEPSPATSATWICPICSFSNPVPSNFDPVTSNTNTPLPPCLACGIKPPFSHVLKAAISSAGNRPVPLVSSSIKTPVPRSGISHNDEEMLGGGSNSESLYISELSRNLAEFLMDDARGVLRKTGGIITLVDLWATFNRARGGVELVSPLDFEKAARLWEKLKLPVRLRQFRSGVLVVQGSDRTDEKTIKTLLTWLRDLHVVPPEKEVPWDWHEFGRGVTSQDAAEHFGWSIGVAEEELEMAEERGPYVGK